jgi:hypothetical protein
MKLFYYLVAISILHLLCACGDEESLDNDSSSGSDDVSEEEKLSSLSSDRFITSVVEFNPAEEASFGQDKMPEVIEGPPHGGGADQGSLDVVSLGCGGEIIVELGGGGAADGPGPDFLIFENPFEIAGDQSGKAFIEPAEVLVSASGDDWKSFGCFGDEENPLHGCAGINPVLSTPDNEISPCDAAAAGGDAFDLSEIGLAKAKYVKLVDKTVEYYGNRLWCGASGGFDLDAMAVINAP